MLEFLNSFGSLIPARSEWAVLRSGELRIFWHLSIYARLRLWLELFRYHRQHGKPIPEDVARLLAARETCYGLQRLGIQTVPADVAEILNGDAKEGTPPAGNAGL